MRSEAEMFALILKVAKNLPEVLAVGMNGSRTNKNAPKDDFQDYDIVYVVKNKEKLIQDKSWLQEFGEILVSQEPEKGELFPKSLGERYTFLMQFQDGNRIDLMLCPLSEVDHWLKEDKLIEILADPYDILPEMLPASDEDYWVTRPSEQMVQDSWNEFWWVATYVVKGICRQELFYASDHFYENCRGELLRMLSYKVGVMTHFSLSVGKNYKYLKNYLPKDTMEKLAQFQDLSSFSTLSQNLVEMENFFFKEGQGLAESLGYKLEKKMAENVLQYTKENLKEYLC